MFGWISAGLVFLIIVWLLGHGFYLMTQMRKKPSGDDGQHDGGEGEADDEHR